MSDIELGEVEFFHGFFDSTLQSLPLTIRSSLLPLTRFRRLVGHLVLVLRTLYIIRGFTSSSSLYYVSRFMLYNVSDVIL